MGDLIYLRKREVCMTLSQAEISSLHFNQQQAIAHLQTLGYSESTPIYLRCFPCHKGNARNLQGTLANFPWTTLQQLQNQGYGVYFVANGQGHKDVDVRAGRVLFFEHDDLEKSLQQELWQTLNLPEPTIQIDTGGKSIHSYWRLEPACEIADWRELQADLLEFAQADRSIKNPARVMRLAGFRHQGTGQLSTILNASGQIYTVPMLRALIPHRHSVETLQQPSPVPLEICLTRDNRGLIQQGAPQGQRNIGGTKLARDLIGTEQHLRQIGQLYAGTARALFERYCSRCDPPIAEKEIEQIWKSAEAARPTSSLTEAAIANCIAAWYQRSRNPNLPKTTTSSDPKPESNSRLVRDFRCIEMQLANRLRLNTLKNRIELDGQSFDRSKAQLILALEHNLDMGCGREQIEDIVTLIAERNFYSPVVDYLEAVHATHGDDTQILTGFAARHFGEPEPIADIFIKRWLISAVARAFSPGCKADYILVLQGKQGFGKSGFFNTLANGWFDDGIAATASDKDQLLKIHSAWIVELSELEAIFRKKDVSAFKAFITARTDAIRKPYGRIVEELPRTNVFGATTNEDGFLNDPTGNRRFWVVQVHQPINIANLEQEKDRIWAAAVALYKAHEQWYPTELEAIAAETIAQDYQQADPWLEPIHTFVCDLNTVLTAVILESALQIEIGRQTKADEMRVASCLRELGFQPTRKTINGRRTRIWQKTVDNRDSVGQPPLPPLSHAENPSPQEVDSDGDNRDNLNPRHESARSNLPIFHTTTPYVETPIEKVVPVVQAVQSLEESTFQPGQPPEQRLSRLSTSLAALQMGDRIAIWDHNHWQPATLIALPNHHPHPSQRIQAWKVKLDTGTERYVWTANKLQPWNDSLTEWRAP